MCHRCKLIEYLSVQIFQLGEQELVHDSIDHLITGESNDSIWCCSQQICCTTSVETSNSLLVEHLLYAVNYTIIPYSTIGNTALFLQLRPYNLAM